MSKTKIDQDPRFKSLCMNVNACWQSIGSDVLTCAAEMDEEVTNEEAVQSCLDADRMRMYPGGLSGNESADFVTEMAKVGRYDELERAVCKVCILT